MLPMEFKDVAIEVKSFFHIICTSTITYILSALFGDSPVYAVYVFNVCICNSYIHVHTYTYIYI